MTRPLLEGTDVARSLGGLRVLHRVSFAVAEGEIVALIGRPTGSPGSAWAAPSRPRGGTPAELLALVEMGLRRRGT